MLRKRTVFSIVLMLAVLAGMAFNPEESDALGGFLKNKFKGKDATQEATPAQEAASPEKTKPESSEPLVFENTKYKYKFTYPGDWELKADDPKKSLVTVVDTWGELGNMIINATWMSDDFPVDAAFNALKDKAEQRKKHGELSEYYVKNIPGNSANGKDVVKGVVIIESDEDPDMKRMQWEAYGGGNYYNFTWSTNVAKFPKYKDNFQKMLDSIEFNLGESN